MVTLEQVSVSLKLMILRITSWRLKKLIVSSTLSAKINTEMQAHPNDES